MNDERHLREGLSSIELELYDLLKQDTMTKDEEIRVKNAAQSLLKRLQDGTPKVLVQDWFRSEESSNRVRSTIRDTLDATLPASYNVAMFGQALDTTYDHIYRQANQGGHFAV